MKKVSSSFFRAEFESPFLNNEKLPGINLKPLRKKPPNFNIDNIDLEDTSSDSDDHLVKYIKNKDKRTNEEDYFSKKNKIRRKI